MEKFIKYFWIDRGDPGKDIYVELSAEEGKKGSQGGKFLISMESDSASVLGAYLHTKSPPSDGIVRVRFSSLEEAESVFGRLYKEASSKSDIVVS